jgi:hypothetical protein
MFQIVHVTIHFGTNSLVEHKAPLSRAPYYQCRAPRLLAPYFADPAKHYSTISASRKKVQPALTRLTRFTITQHTIHYKVAKFIAKSSHHVNTNP